MHVYCSATSNTGLVCSTSGYWRSMLVLIKYEQEVGVWFYGGIILKEIIYTI